MAIQPLDAVTLHDLSARFPFFSALPFVGMDHPVHPTLDPSRQVPEPRASNPTHLKLGDIPSEDISRHFGATPTEVSARRGARSVSFPLTAQNVPSANSITLIAGLAERHIAPLQSIALYERTAQPTHTPRTVTIG